MSVIIKNIKKVVVIDDTEIINIIKNIPDKNERNRVVREYIKNKYGGKHFSKKFIRNNCTEFIDIHQTKTDLKTIVSNKQFDIEAVSTQLDELISASEYVIEGYSTKKKKNGYFWYFKVTVEIDGDDYIYLLNIGKNKYDGNISLHSIENYNEKKIQELTVNQERGYAISSTSIVDEKNKKVKFSLNSSDEFELTDREIKEIDKWLDELEEIDG